MHAHHAHHASGRPRAAALATLAALIVVLFGAPSGGVPVRGARPGQDAPSEGNSELKDEYDEVLGQESALLAQLAETQAAKAKATEELADLATKTTEMQFQLLSASEELTQAETLSAIRTEERRVAEQKVESAVTRLRAQIVASYVSGGDDSSVLEAVLNADNGEEAGKVLAFGRAITDTTQTLVDDLEAARAEKRTADEEAKAAKAAAETHKEEVSVATTFLAAARDQKEALVAEQSLQILAEGNTLSEIRSRKVLVESRINALSRASDGVQLILADLQQGQPDFVPGEVPIDNPLPGVRVSSPFGMRHHPILNIDRLHAGCDLGSPTGVEIHAAADGFVVIAGERGGYGNTTVIDHGNSLATLYGHQSRLMVSPGQQVKRGDVIGLVGSTGLSTGPHVHFETRIKGVPVDPEGIVDFEAPVDYENRPEDSTTTTTG